MPRECKKLWYITNRPVELRVSYEDCQACGGVVEVWSDEDKSLCLNCGEEWLHTNKNE
jgi:predicted RNA-binding Zn-ribbon protein involved in translation (DUF1610 family)